MSWTIVLENFQQEYHPGSLVEGKIAFRFTASEIVRDIVVKLIGEEQTKWSRIAENSGQRTNVVYKGSNVFLTMEGSLSEGGNFDAGTHEFPFKFVLPRHIPGTYTCKSGTVKFFIKAAASGPHSLSYWIVKNITVKSPIYLEYVKEKWFVRHHQTAERSNSSLWCVSGGSVTIDVLMSKRAFAYGEDVKVEVDITNTTQEHISRVELLIGQMIELKANIPKVDTETKNEILVSEKLDGVDFYSQRSYTFLVKIPRLAVVPNFSRCQLFSQKCYIKVIAVAKSYNPTISTYIIIGDHYPNTTTSNYYPVATEDQAYNPRPSAPSTTSSRFRSPPLLPTSVSNAAYPFIGDLETPPPSYDVVWHEVTKKKQTRRTAEAVAEHVPSAPPQTPPTAPPPIQSSMLYPPIPLFNHNRQNVVPYPTGDPLAEWIQNYAPRDIASSDNSAAESGGNVALRRGIQSDDSLYPSPIGPVKPWENIAQQESSVSFTPMPVPQNNLYLPPVSNIALYPTVSSSSSSFTSIPVPTRGLYPPEQQKDVAPYLTEDPLSKWNQIKSAVTDITYSTISFPSVPKESPTVSDDDVDTAKEMVAELSDLPVSHKGAEPQRVNLPYSVQTDSENEVASGSGTLQKPVSSTSDRTVDDGLNPLPKDAVKHPLVSSPLSSVSYRAMPKPSEKLYPPPKRLVGLPVPREELIDSGERVTGENKTEPESLSGPSVPDDGLYPPPMDTVKPPIDSSSSSSVSAPHASMSMSGDQIYPPSKGLDNVPFSVAKEVPTDSDEDAARSKTQKEPSVSSASKTVQNDSFYPPPMDTAELPKGTSNTPVVSNLTESGEEVASSSEIQPSPSVASTPNPDGLYPPPMDAVRPPVASSIVPSVATTSSSDGLYPPPREAVALDSIRTKFAPDDGLYPPPMGVGKPRGGSFNWIRSMPLPSDGSCATSQEVFRPLGFVTSYTATSIEAALVLSAQGNVAVLEDASSSSLSTKDAAKVSSTESNH